MDDTTLSLSVTGMTCAACVASVERVLGEVDGVAAVSVNLPLEKAVISLSAVVGDNDRARCIAAVERAGFGATPLVPALQTRRNNEDHVAQLGRQVALAFALTLPVFVLSMVLDDFGSWGPWTPGSRLRWSLRSPFTPIAGLLFTERPGFRFVKERRTWTSLCILAPPSPWCGRAS